MAGSVGPRIYNLFPLLAGTIDNWHAHLPRIAAMGFDWIFLNPFHAPGFSGSLYAVQDYYRLHPLLRGSSNKPDDRLIADFCADAARQGLSVMMDLVINHTAKDSVLAERYPHWFLREADGSLRSPFAIDPADSRKVTVWGDLAEIDYADRPARAEMTAYWQEVVRHFAQLGIRGFRGDAAYKVPSEVWRPLIAAAREVQPEAIFLAETLGCRLDEVEALRPAGFDFLFNSAKWWDFRAPWLVDQYNQFRGIAPSIAFPESHDTQRLATELAASGMTDPHDIERAYRQRYLFVATFSTGVMMPMGFELGFRRKVDVVETRPEDWEQPLFDLQGFVGEVNRMKASLPVLNVEGPQRQLVSPTGAAGLLRRPLSGPGWVLTVANPDLRSAWALTPGGHDLVERRAGKGREVTPWAREPRRGPMGELVLGPGEIRVFAGDDEVVED